MSTIDVLLATYNGEKYLEEQIDSLFSQTCQGFRLIVRDDGSSDNTVSILRQYQKKHESRLILLDTDAPTGTAKGNFTKLTATSDADYTMYCDQDDYWHPTKIETTLAAMQYAEQQFPSRPILVHGDLRVVGAEREIIADSLWKYQGLDQSQMTINRLAVQNNITGCTVMINRTLRQRATPFPAGMIMHDWWLGLVASALGNIATIQEPLIDYRQHGSNDTGAKNYNLGYILQRASRVLTAERLMEFKDSIERSRIQATALLKHLGGALPDKDRKNLEIYSQLGTKNAIYRRYFVLRYGFLKQGLARNLAYLMSI